MMTLSIGFYVFRAGELAHVPTPRCDVAPGFSTAFGTPRLRERLSVLLAEGALGLGQEPTSEQRCTFNTPSCKTPLRSALNVLSSSPKRPLERAALRGRSKAELFKKTNKTKTAGTITA